MTSIQKHGYYMSVSEEWLWINNNDPRYERLEKSRVRVPAPESEWELYRQAGAAMELVNSYEGFHLYNDYDLLPPEDKWDIEYAETVDEWKERCRELDRQGGPVKTDGFLDSIAKDMLNESRDD